MFQFHILSSLEFPLISLLVVKAIVLGLTRYAVDGYFQFFQLTFQLLSMIAIELILYYSLFCLARMIKFFSLFGRNS